MAYAKIDVILSMIKIRSGLGYQPLQSGMRRLMTQAKRSSDIDKIIGSEGDTVLFLHKAFPLQVLDQLSPPVTPPAFGGHLSVYNMVPQHPGQYKLT